MNSKTVSVFFGSNSLKVLLLLDMNTEKSVLFDSNSENALATFGMNPEKVSTVWQ